MENAELDQVRTGNQYRLFSAENSVFSGEVRAYLRLEHDQGDLDAGYEDILVTPELISGLLFRSSRRRGADGSRVRVRSSIIASRSTVPWP